MSTRSLIRIFDAAFVMTAALPLAAWDYRTCFGSKITWGSKYQSFTAANVSFPEGSVRNALDGSVGAWNIAPGFPVALFLSYGNLSAATIPNWSNEIIFSTEGFDPNTLAVTNTWNNCSNLQEADVIFNANKTWSFNLNPTTLPDGFPPYSFPLVAIHELGHAYGLQHQASLVTMMAPIYPNGGVVGQLHEQHFQPLADDVEGARVVYWTCCALGRDLFASAYATYNETQTGLIIPASQAFRGGRTGFGFTVGNRGTSAETVQVNFYFSNDRWIDTSDMFLGSTTLSIPAGVNKPPGAVYFDLPLDFPVGNYYFGYIVDPSNAIGEADEANNAVAMGFPTQVPSYTPPYPCFSKDPSTGIAPLSVNFDATCSGDVDGFIASYSWNFGDGGGGSGATTSHVYDTPGQYTITLTVTDNQGYSRQTTDNVLVSDSSGCIICE